VAATTAASSSNTDDTAKKTKYIAKATSDAVRQARGIPGGNVVFNLAITPTLFGNVAAHLGDAGLLHETPDGFRRVIIEKPFGRDLDSARELNNELHGNLKEAQIYRIDHYLGKETVQNIMVFRFANMIFEPNWNRRYVDSVQITVAERLGVENRGGYLDNYGVLRDMVQNHMLSVLSLIAMEPPGNISGDAVRNEKVKVLEAIRPMEPEEVLENCVRGQYGAGIIDGRQVPAYRDEPSVNPHSNTETYAALRLFVENWRWADVPFYLRTGKRLMRIGREGTVDREGFINITAPQDRAFLTLATEYEQNVDQLQSYVTMNPAAGARMTMLSSYLRESNSYLLSVKNMARRIRDGVPYTSSERFRIFSATFGRYVEGTPENVLDRYNSLVRTYNYLRF
jgi:glucose-6-phosphate 1-dehydrogenase